MPIDTKLDWGSGPTTGSGSAGSTAASDTKTNAMKKKKTKKTGMGAVLGTSIKAVTGGAGEREYTYILDSPFSRITASKKSQLEENLADAMPANLVHKKLNHAEYGKQMEASAGYAAADGGKDDTPIGERLVNIVKRNCMNAAPVLKDADGKERALDVADAKAKTGSGTGSGSVAKENFGLVFPSALGVDGVMLFDARRDVIISVPIKHDQPNSVADQPVSPGRGYVIEIPNSAWRKVSTQFGLPASSMPLVVRIKAMALTGTRQNVVRGGGMCAVAPQVLKATPAYHAHFGMRGKDYLEDRVKFLELKRTRPSLCALVSSEEYTEREKLAKEEAEAEIASIKKKLETEKHTAVVAAFRAQLKEEEAKVEAVKEARQRRVAAASVDRRPAAPVVHWLLTQEQRKELEAAQMETTKFSPETIHAVNAIAVQKKKKKSAVADHKLKDSQDLAKASSDALPSNARDLIKEKLKKETEIFVDSAKAGGDPLSFSEKVCDALHDTLNVIPETCCRPSGCRDDDTNFLFWTTATANPALLDDGTATREDIARATEKMNRLRTAFAGVDFTAETFLEFWRFEVQNSDKTDEEKARLYKQISKRVTLGLFTPDPNMHGNGAFTRNFGTQVFGDAKAETGPFWTAEHNDDKIHKRRDPIALLCIHRAYRIVCAEFLKTPENTRATNETEFAQKYKAAVDNAFKNGVVTLNRELLYDTLFEFSEIASTEDTVHPLENMRMVLFPRHEAVTKANVASEKGKALGERGHFYATMVLKLTIIDPRVTDEAIAEFERRSETAQKHTHGLMSGSLMTVSASVAHCNLNHRNGAGGSGGSEAAVSSSSSCHVNRAMFKMPTGPAAPTVVHPAHNPAANAAGK